jgi:hypothetical protein
MTNALFCDITQREVVISYRRFGTINRAQDRTARLSRNVGNKLLLLSRKGRFNRYILTRVYLSFLWRIVILWNGIYSVITFLL